MRVRSTTFLISTLIAAIAALTLAAGAFADSGSGNTSSPPSEDSTAPVTEVPPAEKPKPPVTKPPVTSAPVTSAPVTSAPVTSAPVTSAPVTSSSTCSDTSSCESVPGKPELPTEPKCAAGADCAPITPDQRDVPDAPGGGGDLPFTGPGDVVLAIVLALLAGTGGILFLFGAAGREQLDGLRRRDMDSPSGFQLAYRELRKQQFDR